MSTATLTIWLMVLATARLLAGFKPPMAWLEALVLAALVVPTAVCTVVLLREFDPPTAGPEVPAPGA
ncbi:MAG TPA: hypothetical protein VKP69_04150 [Isosphaeraceae bacterium]|nr:hypothetical protein [Isosphaeraceae bacterium]